ncbi:MAG TPA: MBL fold metallo-hydrolase [Bacteroidales bacterium]|nr:MBL fold metallo-hydrolase [Bacteroidales bacterium]
MKITFLGTGTSQGVPVIACDCAVCLSDDPKDNRLRAALLVETASNTFVIDAGPDFRQQMLRARVKKIDGIFLTHEHKDHISGMDDLRAFNYRSQAAMDIYAEERVQVAVRKEYAYVFSENLYPGVPKMELHDIDKYNIIIGEETVIPLRIFHYRLPILGFRIGDMAYITDANYIPEETKEKLIGVKYLIINALRKEKHISHFSLGEALSFVEEISPRYAFITHIGHQMGKHADINRELPANVTLAWDGLEVSCTE